MKIIVCIKQVPSVDTVKIDPENGMLIRTSDNTTMNPYDLSGIETALKIREMVGAAEIVAITMGPPQAQQIIKYAFEMGVDKGILLTDVGFAGADVMATAYTLARRIEMEKPDLVICGRQTTDGDTGQVGGVLAEELDIPHISWVLNINNADQVEINMAQGLLDHIATLKVKYPCLISVEKDIFTPRLPSLKLKLKAKKMELEISGITDIEGMDKNRCGIAGSPTSVRKIFAPKRTKGTKILTYKGKDAASLCMKIIKETLHL